MKPETPLQGLLTLSNEFPCYPVGSNKWGKTGYGEPCGKGWGYGNPYLDMETNKIWVYNPETSRWHRVEEYFNSDQIRAMYIKYDWR